MRTAHFKDCKKFGWIHLADTQVTVAGLVNFKDSKSPYFDLRGTQISDADLKELAAMSTLFGLDLKKHQSDPSGHRRVEEGFAEVPHRTRWQYRRRPPRRRMGAVRRWHRAV